MISTILIGIWMVVVGLFFFTAIAEKSVDLFFKTLSFTIFSILMLERGHM